MTEILEETYRKEYRRGGHPLKLSVLDKLVIILSYYRDYRTMESIAFDYGVSKSTVYESIRWAEESLMKSGKFSLPSKKALIDDLNIEVVYVDVTECEIERPQKTEAILLREEKKTYAEGTADRKCENATRFMALLNKLRQAYNMSLVMITHDEKLVDRTDVVYKINDGVISRKRLSQVLCKPPIWCRIEAE